MLKLAIYAGASNFTKQMKNKGYKIVIFSGGFRNATSKAVLKFNLDGDFANILHQKDGILTGLVGGDMMFNFSKGDMLKRLQKILGISQEDTIVIGDGANDKSMFEFAQKKVAFCAHKILEKEANIVIKNKNLEEILNYV